MKLAALFVLLLHGATATNTCVTDFDADAGVDYYPTKGEHYRFSDLLVMSRVMTALFMAFRGAIRPQITFSV